MGCFQTIFNVEQASCLFRYRQTRCLSYIKNHLEIQRSGVFLLQNQEVESRK